MGIYVISPDKEHFPGIPADDRSESVLLTIFRSFGKEILNILRISKLLYVRANAHGCGTICNCNELYLE